MNTIATRISSALLLCLAFTAADAQRGPLATALPATPYIQLSVDPLDAPTDHCDFNAARNNHVKLNYQHVATSRRLRRDQYPDTDIRSLKPGSPHWVTGCPVKLTRGILKTPVCRALDVFLPQNSNAPVLRIAQSDHRLVFKIENTKRGLIKGELIRKTNPHGGPEEVWLESRNVTRDGMPENFIYYVFLRDDDSLKQYLVEVFDPGDQTCMNAHLPSAATLCMNPATTSNTCVMPLKTATAASIRSSDMPQSAKKTDAMTSVSSDTFQTNLLRGIARGSAQRDDNSIERSGQKLQGDTGEGIEPPPVDN